MLILGMTRYLNRTVISRQRLKVLEDKRKRGHDSIAASVFDISAIAIEEEESPIGPAHPGCALEQDPRLAMMITTLWAKPEFLRFLQRLFNADAGEGKMLAPEVRQELVFLRKLYVDQKRAYARTVLAAGPVRATRGPVATDTRWQGVA